MKRRNASKWIKVGIHHIVFNQIKGYIYTTVYVEDTNQCRRDIVSKITTIANRIVADIAMFLLLREKTGKFLLQRKDGFLHPDRDTHVSEGPVLGARPRWQRSVQDQEKEIDFTGLSFLQVVELFIGDDLGRFFVRVGDVLRDGRVVEAVLLRRSPLRFVGEREV